MDIFQRTVSELRCKHNALAGPFTVHQYLVYLAIQNVPSQEAIIVSCPSVVQFKLSHTEVTQKSVKSLQPLYLQTNCR